MAAFTLLSRCMQYVVVEEFGGEKCESVVLPAEPDYVSVPMASRIKLHNLTIFRIRSVHASRKFSTKVSFVTPTEERETKFFSALRAGSLEHCGIKI